jgi:hypothetical protein
LQARPVRASVGDKRKRSSPAAAAAYRGDGSRRMRLGGTALPTGVSAIAAVGDHFDLIVGQVSPRLRLTMTRARPADRR